MTPENLLLPKCPYCISSVNARRSRRRVLITIGHDRNCPLGLGVLEAVRSRDRARTVVTKAATAMWSVMLSPLVRPPRQYFFFNVTACRMCAHASTLHMADGHCMACPIDFTREIGCERFIP